MHETRALEVRTTRRAKGWTQQQLADKAGVSLRSVRNVENKKKNVSPATTASVYRALGMPGPPVKWPKEVDNIVQMVAYHLTSIDDPEKRMVKILKITRLVVDESD